MFSYPFPELKFLHWLLQFSLLTFQVKLFLIRLTTLFDTCFRDYVPPVVLLFCYQKWDQLMVWPLKVQYCRWLPKIHASVFCTIAQELASPSFEFRESFMQNVYICINWHQHLNYFPVMSNITCFFLNWFIQAQITQDAICSDEALFIKQGIYNHRNEHFCSNESQYVAIQEWSQETFSIHMWAGLLNDKLLGPIEFPLHLKIHCPSWFLVRSTSESYRRCCRRYADCRLLYFQLDGSETHYRTVTRKCFNENWTDRWIRHGGPI